MCAWVAGKRNWSGRVGTGDNQEKNPEFCGQHMRPQSRGVPDNFWAPRLPHGVMRFSTTPFSLGKVSEGREDDVNTWSFLL